MGFDFAYMIELLPILFKYLGTTLEMAVWGLFFALALALVLANLRVFKVPVLDQLSQLYISFFRGTPLLVQLFLLYYGLPQVFPIFVGLDAFSAAVIGLTLHFAAYMAESIRAAIIGVDRSQMEASLSIGMTTSQAMRRIILPQATRIALPSLMNYFIDMIKSTSLAFTLGVSEIMAKAQMEASSSFKFFEAFLAVALIYWGVVIILTQVQTWAEKKLNKAYVR
ncbi:MULTISPECIES: amino acid ABC transporter permease [Aliivibrio]|jgi:putative amino-acid transport system permease protein|uniref:ABC transporter permease n=3 Tax=Aliivibrio TaxID=511678 RepID=A0A1B9NVV6_ALILO|nr:MULTISPECIES: amino acid ABC transporter permease [Aliivibrio]AZL83622.1 amino acid ABC transporter permease [Aliivibrio salmonicida]MBB1313243.1 amino acid ABC transporter permease [Aliivibrio sp. SR45-2]OCH18723.1 ABC transporter permease [Aliivibrio logei]OEF13393.1 ABC transporter permease [Aliivibrio logei 5S-186]CAQ77692.1 putative amino-acid ABC transporter, permease protein [Aliivibrio salmonicida LFI1238]